MIDASASITFRGPRELRDAVHKLSNIRGESVATTLREIIRDAAKQAGIETQASHGNQSVRPLSRLDK